MAQTCDTLNNFYATEAFDLRRKINRLFTLANQVSE